ncbi:MAG TPA: cytochrome P450 [Solirubrobacteraceae bacterium]|nr:cytochrome P450 [Solirubrobacteraceae bacterium]
MDWSTDLNAWVARDPADVEEGLRSESLSAERGSRLRRISSPEAISASALDAFLSRWPMLSEGPQHRATRRVVREAFKRLDSKEVRSRVSDFIVETAIRAGSVERFDAIQEITRPISLVAIRELFDIPPATFAEVDAAGRDVVGLIGVSTPTAADVRRGSAALDVLINALPVLAREGCRGLSVIRSAAAAAGLEDETADAVAINLFIDGQQPLESIIATGLVRICRQLPRDTETVISDAAPFEHCSRVAVAELSLGGATIRTGEKVRLEIGQAARVDESHRRQLAFGAGRHFCPAAGYVRFVVARSLRELDRMGGLALDPEESVLPRASSGYRGILRLPLVRSAL